VAARRRSSTSPSSRTPPGALPGRGLVALLGLGLLVLLLILQLGGLPGRLGCGGGSHGAGDGLPGGGGGEIVGRARDDGPAGEGPAQEEAESPMAADEDGLDAPEALVPEVVAVYPHDPGAFTQGLLVHEDRVYESTGLRGRSSLRRVRPATGEIELRRDLEPRLFGEGLARRGDRLVQLTWEAGRALVYDLSTFAPLAEHAYPGEGWGLCFDGSRFIRSDGSDRLFFHRPDDFRDAGSVVVRRRGRPVRRLNELECVDGVVWANVWMEDVILRIDPTSGEVTGEVDARALSRATRAARRADAVLNGVAHLPGTDRFYVTGKLWDRLYEVRFVPADRGGRPGPEAAAKNTPASPPKSP